jgi:hypothetical protein
MQTTQPQVDPTKLSNKLSALNELLSTHHSVYVHLDSRRPGVIVPTGLKQAQLVLQLGLNLKPFPIRELIIDDKGFSATLSFGRAPFPVFVPWAAVFLIAGDSGIGCQYPKDVPPEALVKQERVASGKAPLPTNRDPEKHKKLPPGWGIIDGGKK